MLLRRFLTMFEFIALSAPLTIGDSLLCSQNDQSHARTSSDGKPEKGVGQTFAPILLGVVS